MILKQWQEEILKREINEKRRTNSKGRSTSDRSTCRKEPVVRR